MTRTGKLTFLAISVVTTIGTANAALILLPGAPCPNPQVPCTAGLTSTAVRIQAVFNLVNDPGVNNLGIFVVPGDVVLFEIPNGALTAPRTTWSDVVRFQDGANGSVAIIYADNENGVILPPGFVLSANAVGLVELQNGTGTDADFTNYSPDNNVTIYQIHSDAANPEIADPEVPEPATLGLLGSGLAAMALLARKRRMRSA